MDPVQEIKNKLAVEDVVAQYIPLKRAGKYLKARCPFHEEKTASFFVSPEKQLAYCFSCHKGGDLFQFIQDIEGLSFKESLDLLAEKAGVELPKFSGKAGPSKDVKERLRQINQDASNFFVQQLNGSDSGLKVKEYLKQRGMEDKTIAFFDVGFAPDSKDELYRYLLEKKHSKDDLLASTLAVARDSASEQVSDRFHLRLMFPIDDSQGNIVAYGGRALKKGDKPKYLNSPEYALYNKSATLYNLGRAKSAIREADVAIVVEGYFDVMASHQAGFPNVVATCGTALTEQQFKLIKRYTHKVALAFDTDSAGQDALLRAVHTAQPLGLEVFVIQIPEGKDAADAVKENPKIWQDAAEAKMPYIEHFESIWSKQYNLLDSTGKREYTDKMLDLLKGVEHPVERDHHLKLLSKAVGTPIDLLYDYLNQMKSDRTSRSIRSSQEEASEQKISFDKKERLYRYFLALLLAFPNEFFEVWERFSDHELFLGQARKLGIVGPVHKLNETDAKTFREDFETVLKDEAHQIDVSSVYKQVKDQYNLGAELGDAFYANLKQSEELRKLSFEAEVKNPDQNLVRKEFEKLITLLYLEFTP